MLQNVISIGAGEELVSQYRSVIFYHSGKPEWVETIKVSYTLCVLESCLKANTEEFERIIYGQGRFLYAVQRLEATYFCLAKYPLIRMRCG